ncbi:type II toxin-antitoxin system VapC family toxin [Candidatus Woesebacteria bacterium]|nr:type II toxin-antitoxin system VapC family toxin [Candidatus Woesebacteria bacterium]
MAKLFFDTNCFVHLYTKRAPFPFPLEKLENYDLYVSPLSYHVLSYVEKVKIPNQELLKSLDKFYLTDLNEQILTRALGGPTNDLEDNIQLQSANEASCDYFLTLDKKLLKMKSFGKTEIVNSLK